MTLRTFALGSMLASSLVLAGCGTTTGDRTVSGGLLGAGTGALIGSLSGDAGKGAIIGGLAGATLGALTDPCDIDLGKPPWKNRSEKEAWEKKCGRHYGD